LFVTGRAGTGKSTLLQYFRRTTAKKVAVVAPTGVAALNVGGQTIHSFFNFPAKTLLPKDIRRQPFTKLYEKLDVLVIDEISMVRADLLDNMDRFLRINRNRLDEPFGGVQVAMFGDLFQLPPVVSLPEEREMIEKTYGSPYFFAAHVWKSGARLHTHELRQVYRQTNRRFLRLLDAVRLNEAEYDELEELNERYDPNFPDTENYITLSARNATADELNTRRLAQLPTEEFMYLGQLSGDFPPTCCPADPALKLKVGAQVMFVKNDTERRFVNGTIGKVCGLDLQSVEVAVPRSDGTVEIITVSPAVWESHRFKLNAANGAIETETVGTYKQMPLRLAWAVTIHKSQGKTFERMVIDLGRGGAFEHGQTYVALSRCTSLEGIVLKQRLTHRDIRTDPRVVEFFAQSR
jgi:ATP-dependent exoDNAse (exonuclease V) alpha subunit